MRANQRESGFAMVKNHILPTAGVVAAGAFRAKLSIVNIICSMAGYARIRCAFEDTIYMASLACHGRMFSV